MILVVRLEQHGQLRYAQSLVCHVVKHDGQHMPF
jgi:hypothetical protein